MDYKSRRLSLYSSILYVLGFGVSIWITWLSGNTFIVARQSSMKIAGLVAAVLGIVLVLTCLLVFWILIAEVVGFEIHQDGSISLQRLWLKPMSHVTQVRLLLRIGCVLRADGSRGECVRYVILWADKKLVPMPAEIYSRLGANVDRS
jgi:hypothetical protein